MTHGPAHEKSSPHTVAGDSAAVTGRRARWPRVRIARLAALLALSTHMLLTITGAFVRVTGSGLGCPTWPECMPGSYTPVTVPATAYHAWVEFGNRLLTFVVVVASIACFAAYLWLKRGDRDGILRTRATGWLAASAFLGTVAQAVVGGISVLTQLSPAWVSAHFLLSAIILLAITRYLQALQPAVHGEFEKPGQLQYLRRARLLVASAAATLLLGTVVTGSGPHAGDAKVTERFPFDPARVTVIHSLAAALVVGVTIIMWVGRNQLMPRQRAALGALLLLEACQGALGYIQYRLGLPPLMVVAHVALSVSIWVGALRLMWSFRRSS